MMRLSHLKIEGFRSLASVEIPMHDLTILIGRNNAGKSNVLAALQLLLEGTARDLSAEIFHNAGDGQTNEVVIEAQFEGVDDYLPLCADRHRPKIAGCLQDGLLRVRRMASLSPLQLGKLELWQPDKDEFGLPTGIEAALKQFLPEVIYIEAFKDPTTEAQAKGTATLGKLLKQIVEQVTDQVETDVTGILEEAARKFNVFEREGKISDERPAELRRVEQRIRHYVGAIFEGADARLKFDLPAVADFLAAATIELKDRGPWTSPDMKGQGFQRALYLALLQALADEMRSAPDGELNRPFILLFEEPEAFLHPALQREMGEVLVQVSRGNQVVIATHSPLLVTPSRIGDVVILKQEIGADSQSCGTRCLIPDTDCLPDPEDKRLASLLKFASSAEFLFADHVLVVEGPSDRALLEAARSVLRASLCTETGPMDLAVIEAGSKDTVPVWIRYLRAIGIEARGVVDLDFLWNGAGRCMGSDPELSQFAASFWTVADEKGVSTTEDGKTSIQKGNKGDAFRLIQEHLAEQQVSLSARLRREHAIWVLERGEIETYFGLAASSKGHYAVASQKVRNGELAIESEIRAIIAWAFSAWIHQIRLPDEVTGALYLGSLPGKCVPFEYAKLAIFQREISAVISVALPEEVQRESPDYASAITSEALPWEQIDFPISAHNSALDRDALLALVRSIADRLRAGDRLLVHCDTGIGRAGMLAASILLALGIDKEQAYQAVRATACEPETSEQKGLVNWVAEKLAIQVNE